MPQMPASIILADGQATPVNKTFEAQIAQVGQDQACEFWEKSAGSLSGYRRLSVLTRKSKTGNGLRTIVKISLPVLETVSGSSPSGFAPAPAVAYTTLATLEIVHPERNTLQDRKDMFAFLKNFFSNTTFQAVVQNQETYY